MDQCHEQQNVSTGAASSDLADNYFIDFVECLQLVFDVASSASADRILAVFLRQTSELPRGRDESVSAGKWLLSNLPFEYFTWPQVFVLSFALVKLYTWSLCVQGRWGRAFLLAIQHNPRHTCSA